MNVLFVVTEHVRHLTAERRRRYERTAKLLEELAGSPPTVVHYADPAGFHQSDAIVLSGSDAPWAEHDEAELERLRAFAAGSGRPVLGICAGMQLLAQSRGGAVGHAAEAERGFLPVEITEDALVDRNGLFRGLPARITVYQSHTDEITDLPGDFRVLASSPQSRIQAIASETLGFWGTQFHPEHATHEHPAGRVILQNFFTLARAFANSRSGAL